MQKPWVFAIGLVLGMSLAAAYFVFVRLQRDGPAPTIVMQAPPALTPPAAAPPSFSSTPSESSTPATAPEVARPDASTPPLSKPETTTADGSTPEVLKQDTPRPETPRPDAAKLDLPKSDAPSPSVAAITRKPAPSVPLPPPSASASATPPALAGLIVPVVGVRPDKLSDTYNDRRGGNRPHEALDIMAPRGTPVVAVADGKVVKLFSSKPGGLTLYQFDPKETVAYYYAHLDRYAPGVVEGLSLKQGEVIGYVGNTGNASPEGPHLHFAIFKLGPEKRWWQGTPVNPFGYLTQH